MPAQTPAASASSDTPDSVVSAPGNYTLSGCPVFGVHLNPPEKQLDKDTQSDPALRMAFLTDFLVAISPKVHVKMPWDKARDSVFAALGDIESRRQTSGLQ